MSNLNDQLFAELLASQLTQRAAARPYAPAAESPAPTAKPVPPGITRYIEHLQSENQALKIMLAQALSRNPASR